MTQQSLPDDMIFHLMQFCNFDQMESAMLVSEQWFRMALKFSFKKTISSPFWSKQLEPSINEFRELSNKVSGLLITSLDISGSGIGKMIEEFVKSKNLRNVKYLDIQGSDEQVNVKELFSSPLLKNLTRLEIDRIKIGDDGFKALSESPFIKNLTYLKTFWVGNTYKAAVYIAKSENFSNLTHLDVSDLYEDAVEGVRCLCDSPFLSNLKLLGLSEFADNEIMKLLAESAYLTKLETLFLDRGDFSNEMLKLFLNSNNAKNLTHIEFQYSDLNDEGVKIISECPNMVNLKSLDISSAGVGDIGVRYIIESRYLKNLTRLEHMSDDPYYEGESLSEEMTTQLDNFLNRCQQDSDEYR